MVTKETRHPIADPSAVDTGTPRTSPPVTPTDTRAMARPVWSAGTSRAA